MGGAKANMAGLAVSNGRRKQVGACRARAEHLGVGSGCSGGLREHFWWRLT